jgi:preprotein translocase subunit SecD
MRRTSWHAHCRQQFTHALTLSPDIPGWLTAMGGRPMNLGLDLRGGIHVLIDVDMEAALETRRSNASPAMCAPRCATSVSATSRSKNPGNGVDVRFKDAELARSGRRRLGGEFRELGVTTRDEGEDYFVRVFMPPEEERAARQAGVGAEHHHAAQPGQRTWRVPSR